MRNAFYRVRCGPCVELDGGVGELCYESISHERTSTLEDLSYTKWRCTLKAMQIFKEDCEA